MGRVFYCALSGENKTTSTLKQCYSFKRKNRYQG
jgi:hypothetical protein